MTAGAWGVGRGAWGVGRAAWGAVAGWQAFNQLIRRAPPPYGKLESRAVPRPRSACAQLSQRRVAPLDHDDEREGGGGGGWVKQKQPIDQRTHFFVFLYAFHSHKEDNNHCHTTDAKGPDYC